MNSTVINATESKPLTESIENTRNGSHVREVLPQMRREKINRAAHKLGERLRILNRKIRDQRPVSGCSWEDVNAKWPRKKGGEQSADSVYWRAQGWVV